MCCTLCSLPVYRAGSSRYGWSPLYFFTAMKNGSDWSPRFAVFGDMGNKNAQSLGRLQGEVQRGHYDVLLHVGQLQWLNHSQVRQKQTVPCMPTCVHDCRPVLQVILPMTWKRIMPELAMHS